MFERPWNKWFFDLYVESKTMFFLNIFHKTLQLALFVKPFMHSQHSRFVSVASERLASR